MELINENVSFKIDASGRVVIPASLRKRFGLEVGDKVRYYTVQIDGKWYIVLGEG